MLSMIYQKKKLYTNLNVGSEFVTLLNKLTKLSFRFSPRGFVTLKNHDGFHDFLHQRWRDTVRFDLRHVFFVQRFQRFHCVLEGRQRLVQLQLGTLSDSATLDLLFGYLFAACTHRLDTGWELKTMKKSVKISHNPMFHFFMFRFWVCFIFLDLRFGKFLMRV